jgi:hypothetical protein
MKKSIKIIFIVCLVVALGCGVASYVTKNKTATDVKNELSTQVTDQGIPSGEPVFEWTYSSFDEKEIPHTNIGLIARYPNGATQTKKIDTVEGDCNEYSSPDKDVYSKSKMIICYYAGFGNYYKVVKSDTAYLVKRKIFEEGGEDYNPPQLPFETIAQF